MTDINKICMEIDIAGKQVISEIEVISNHLQELSKRDSDLAEFIYYAIAPFPYDSNEYYIKHGIINILSQRHYIDVDSFNFTNILSCVDEFIQDCFIDETESFYVEFNTKIQRIITGVCDNRKDASTVKDILDACKMYAKYYG